MENKEDEARLAKDESRRWAIFKGVQFFGMLILAFISVVCLYPCALAALILAEFVHIFYCGSHWYYAKKFHYYRGYYKKRFIATIIMGAIAIVISAAVLALFRNDPDTKYVFNFILRIASSVVVIPFLIPMFGRKRGYLCDEKNVDRYIIHGFELSSGKKVLYTLVKILSRVLVALGFFLTIIVEPMGNLYFESVIIVGLIIYGVRYGLFIYCGANRIQILRKYWDAENEKWRSQQNNIQQTESNNMQANTDNDNGERALNEREVEEIVRKIADRFSGLPHTFSFVPGVSLTCNVTYEVVGFSYINFTVNGKLYGVREDNASSAHTYARSKLDDVAFKIKCETENELGKKKLSRSYDITVNIGYLN